MVKKLYLMRHGETLFNTQKRVQGWSDSPLTAVGIEQACQTRAYFEENGISFDYAYSSTQERATDTLKLVTDAPFEQLKGLKEMNFGIFEAREEALLPKFRPGASSFEDLLVPFGGEDIMAVGKRVQKTIETVLKSSSAERLLMVSHGAALWGLILTLKVALPKGFYFSNCAICQFDVSDGKLTLEAVINPLSKEAIALKKGDQDV